MSFHDLGGEGNHDEADPAVGGDAGGSLGGVRDGICRLRRQRDPLYRKTYPGVYARKDIRHQGVSTHRRSADGVRGEKLPFRFRRRVFQARRKPRRGSDLEFPIPASRAVCEKTGRCAPTGLLHRSGGFRARVPHPGQGKLDKGVLRFAPGKRFTAKPGWQKVDYYGELCSVLITPAAGANISFADLRVVPAYPRIGGEIVLSDGGRLTQLLPPAGAARPKR